jgi:hypothetical protein
MTNNKPGGTSLSEIVFIGAVAAGVASATGILLYATYQWEKEIRAERCDPIAHKIFPQECLTPEFFENLNTYVKQGSYQAAVDSFLNPDEQAYATTLGSSGQPEEELVRRLGLKAFLPNVALCGTAETPSCEELLIDPRCGCPQWDYSNSKSVIQHLRDINVLHGTDSRRGKIEVRFDQPMQYVVIDGDKVTVKELATSEGYLTTFTPHWDSNLTYKLEKRK